MRLETRSVSVAESGEEEVHEDVGYVSLSESEGTEGMETFSARMTLRFHDAETYEMILELGTKGKELKPCQTMKLRNVK